MSKYFLNVFQSVMSGIRSLWLEPQGAKWQGYVVYNHQNVFDFDFFFLHPIAKRVAAQVHKS